MLNVPDVLRGQDGCLPHLTPLGSVLKSPPGIPVCPRGSERLRCGVMRRQTYGTASLEHPSHLQAAGNGA